MITGTYIDALLISLCIYSERELRQATNDLKEFYLVGYNAV
jgi:hypothetical protein